MSSAPVIIRDQICAGMWRLQYPDGEVSDMVSLARAKDAVAAHLETIGRRQRARQSPLGAPPMRQIVRGAA
jgi:hypothetical protein